MDNQIKILIVDDDPMNLFVFKDIFQSQDQFICQYAENGNIALQQLASFRPDIILLDIMMPGISGYEVCKQIRQNPKHQFIKIIMVSGKGMLDERLKGYDVGADDYVVKPFDKEEILAKLNVFKRLKRVEEITNNQSNLLALLSHETKTPMSGIMGAVELVSSDQRIPSDLISLLNIIHSSSKQLLAVIEKVTLFYRLTQSYTMNPEPVKLLTALENTLVDLHPEISQKKISIEWISRQDCLIHAEWYFIQIAMQYLIGNAIKYSPKEGKIQIFIEISSNLCKCCISDQGPGIPENHLPEIFEPFAIQDIKHHHKGLGLSLAIARLVFQKHHGDLSCWNNPDKGASFCFELPSQSDQV